MALHTQESQKIEAAARTAGGLTASELHRLTLYKWRYAFEALGFEAPQVSDLMFLKWLYVSQRVTR